MTHSSPPLAVVAQETAASHRFPILPPSQVRTSSESAGDDHRGLGGDRGNRWKQRWLKMVNDHWLAKPIISISKLING